MALIAPQIICSPSIGSGQPNIVLDSPVTYSDTSELIVFVDEHGQPTGETMSKLEAHTASTRLHLAFSCYIFNSRGELLTSRRALAKKVWPGVWSNSICGHPLPDETLEAAINRRLREELGMECHDLVCLVSDYTYQTPPFNSIIEHEFCPIFIAQSNTEPRPNPAEVADYRWLGWEEYVHTLEADNQTWSWWAKDQLRLLLDNPTLLNLAHRKN